VVDGLQPGTAPDIVNLVFSKLDLSGIADGPSKNEVFQIFELAMKLGNPKLACALAQHFKELVPSLKSIEDNPYKKNSLHQAATYGCQDVLDLLLGRIDGENESKEARERIIASRDSIGRTALEWCARAGNLEGFQTLVKRQKTLLDNKSNNLEDTVLHDVIRSSIHVSTDDSGIKSKASSICAKLIDFIVEIKPSALCAFNQMEHSPYTLALELKEKTQTYADSPPVNLEDLIQSLKDHIFRRLCDIGQIRKALYGGKGIICSDYCHL
jgi:ankyrin repeat protein